MDEKVVNDLCQKALTLGYVRLLIASIWLTLRLRRAPLALHAVQFGEDIYYQSLRRMVDIAEEVYATAPRDPLAPADGRSCTFTSALGTIQLANTFMTIAGSLKKPRAALSRT